MMCHNTLNKIHNSEILAFGEYFIVRKIQAMHSTHTARFTMPALVSCLFTCGLLSLSGQRLHSHIVHMGERDDTVKAIDGDRIVEEYV